MLRSFLAAARDGDLEQLVDLLAADAAFYGDGGGKATSTPQPVFGGEKIAAFFIELFGRAERLGITFEPVLVNGGPGIITHDKQDKVVSVLSFEVLDDVVQTVRGVVNPDKLQHLGAVSDVLRIRRGQARGT